MVHHDWSDENFDWKSLSEAETLGCKLMKRIGRIGVHSKEKYGIIRLDLYLSDGSLHSLTHPGYVASQYPKWLWGLNCKFKLPKLLLRPIQLYQALIIKLTFSYLCYKYPHIIDEIIMDAPRDLLSKDLAKRAGKMWKTTCKACGKWYSCDNDKCPNCNK